MRTSLLLSLPLALAIPLSGCGLISQEFDGDVTVDFIVDTEDAIYQDNFIFDPNENEDVRNNRDKISEGKVTAVYLKVTSLSFDGKNTEAQFADGRIYVDGMLVGDATVCTPDATDGCIGKFDSIPLTAVDELYSVKMNTQQKAFLSKIAFEQTDPINFVFIGETDRPGTHLTAQVIFRLEFTANVP